MNIKQELAKAQMKNNIKGRVLRAYSIIKRLLCTHQNCASEIITVTLGNSSDSILSEVVGKDEASKTHVLKLRRVYCIDCGRELYRTIISMDTEESENENESPE